MVWWVTLLWYVGATIVTELLRPKPNLENARPAGLGDFNFPTSQEGRVIPVLWGTSIQKGPNLTWFGDLGSIAITEKVKTGLFSSDTITKGFRYTIGMQLGLCRGQLTNNGVDGIRRVFVDDKQVRPGTGSPGTFPPIDTGTISISKEDFNGEESDLVGTLRVHDGGSSQSVSTYLSGVVAGGATDLPAYNGTAYVVWEGGEIGTSPNLAPWSFEITRIPNGLGFSGSPNMSRIWEDDVPHANPMNVLYEILTDSDWGASVSAALIDTASFIAAGTQLYSEGNGFSLLMDNPKQIGKMIEEIERQCDGVLILDETTGLYEFLLARENTDSPDLTPTVDESNCTSVKFSRTSWENTMNEVRVPYNDPTKDYAESFAVAQDGANNKIQSANVGTTTRFPGCKQGSLAAQLAWRELRFLAYPLSKCTLKVDRNLFAIKPTESIDLTWGPLGISNVRYRVTKVNLGEMESGQISLECLEDIFQTDIASFSDPITSRWQPVSSDPVQPSAITLFEMPIPFMTIGTGTQVGVCVVRGNENQVSYDVWTTLNVNVASSSPFNATSDADFSFEITVHDFTPSGLLQGALPATNLFVEQDSPPQPGIRIDNTTDIGRVVDAGSATLASITNANIVNIILIGREFIFYESITQESPTSDYVLHGIHRGMMNSIVEDHADNARVFFVTLGIGRLPAGNSTIPSSVTQMVARILSSSPTSTIDLANGAEASIELDHASVAEAPPANPSMNNERMVDLGSLTSPTGFTCGDLFFEWKGRNLRDQTDTGPNVDQSFADEDPQGGTSYGVTIFRTDISPSVQIFERTGLAHVGDAISPAGGSYRVKAGAYVIDGASRSPAVGSPLAPLKQYRAELFSERLGVRSKEWTTPEFTIAGYGLDYGENYGGLCEPGVNLPQGAPPLTQEEQGGDDTGVQTWQIAVEGTHAGATDDHRLEVFYSTGQTAEFGTFNIDIDGGTQTTRDDVVQKIVDDLAANLPTSYLIESNISAGLVTVSFTGALGTFSVKFRSQIPGDTIRSYGPILIEEEQPIQSTRQRGFYGLDYWDEVLDNNQFDRVLSAAQSLQYDEAGWYQKFFQVEPMNYDARRDAEAALGTTIPSGGFTVVAEENLDPPGTTTNYDFASSALLSDFQDSEMSFFANAVGRMQIPDSEIWENSKNMERAPLVAIELKDNYRFRGGHESLRFFNGQVPPHLGPSNPFGFNPNPEFDRFVLRFEQHREPLLYLPSGQPRTYWLNWVPIAGSEFIVKINGSVVATAVVGSPASDSIDSIVTQLDALGSYTSQRLTNAEGILTTQIELRGNDTVNYTLSTHVGIPSGLRYIFEEL